MSLETGTKLGAFEILAPIGAGGMGEVYKARDTRLDRTVAIKVLPSHLADNAELKKRFEQEARAISSLNHPNICTLYDVGRENGVDFIVMELLEGETLSERLKKGALPLEEALRIGIELAEALDKAHRQRVVHRDLKPGNVMLTPPGAKLLDFGLAKLAASGPSLAASSLSALPTEGKSARSLTAEGAIIGTFQYMAPEQLEGEGVDARTDIFALGALLYEMVTGRKAFEGKSQASLIGAIMTSQPPPVSQLQATAPPALDHVIRTCLAKDPEDRWQSARDVVRGLRWVSEAGSAPDALPQAAPERRRIEPWKIAAGLGLTALVAALATWAAFRPGELEPKPVRRLSIELPAGASLDSARPGLALSPDGSRLVFSSRSGSRRQLYVRPLDQLEAQPMPGTEGARNPFFSPDGEWIAFFTDAGLGRTLKRVSVLGGPPLTLTETSGFQGSWGDDGAIVFVHDDGGGLLQRGLFRIPAGGGTPERLTTPDPERGEVSHGWPHVLPGGRGIVFSISLRDGIYEESRLALLSLVTGEWDNLVESGYNARYAASGHLVYALSGVLMATPFDLDRLEITGSTVPILEDVAGDIIGGHVSYDLALDGSLVYLTGSARARMRRTLVWVDRDGREEALSAEPRSYIYPRISPDGTRIALDVRDEENDIWTWDVRRETLTRLTFNSGPDQYPVWTPDSKRVVFVSSSSGGRKIHWKSADGTGTAEELAEGRNPYSISSDGKSVTFRTLGNENVGMLSLEGERSTQLLLSGEFIERNGEIAPGDRWLAYESNESGQFEIYVRPLPDVDAGRWQISRNGGTRPLWSPDGRELFYLNLGNQLMATPVENGKSFAPGTATTLLEKAYFVGPNGRPYDITPDGQRFFDDPEPRAQRRGADIANTRPQLVRGVEGARPAAVSYTALTQPYWVLLAIASSDSL